MSFNLYVCSKAFFSFSLLIFFFLHVLSFCDAYVVALIMSAF
jgi:hypothetical protein